MEESKDLELVQVTSDKVGDGTCGPSDCPHIDCDGPSNSPDD